MRRLVVKWVPPTFRAELYRHYARWQIARDTFVSGEPEFSMLSQFVSEGDWVIDVGANVGHYTKVFSDLVGAGGRVISIEPHPTTFSILASTALAFKHRNVSLLCLAASDKVDVCAFSVPDDANGNPNYYRASLRNDAKSVQVLTAPLDALDIANRVSVIKIDVEGHEAEVLVGARRLLQRYRPLLIVETGINNQMVSSLLSNLSYTGRRLPNSPNTLFYP